MLYIHLQDVGLTGANPLINHFNNPPHQVYSYVVIQYKSVVQVTLLQWNKNPSPPLPRLTHDQRIRNHLQKVSRNHLITMYTGPTLGSYWLWNLLGCMYWGPGKCLALVCDIHSWPWLTLLIFAPLDVLWDFVVRDIVVFLLIVGYFSLFFVGYCSFLL